MIFIKPAFVERNSRKKDQVIQYLNSRRGGENIKNDTPRLSDI